MQNTKESWFYITNGNELVIFNQEECSQEMLEGFVTSKIYLNDNITKLTINMSYMDEKLSRTLFDCVKNIKNFESLEIRHCNQTNNDGCVLMSALLEYVPFSSSMLFCNSCLDQYAWASIMKKAEKNKSLTTMVLDNCFLNDSSCKFICDELKSFKNITELTFEYCKITSDGLREIINMLTGNTTLKILNLSDNKFNDQGAVYIHDLLMNNTSIVSLDISRCGVREQGALYIFKALRSNTTLRELYYSGNVIDTVDAVTSFEKTIKTNKSLRVLYIERVCAFPKILRVVIEALKENNTITELSLIENGFDNDTVNALAHYLNNNKTLLSLYISRNKNLQSEFDSIVNAIVNSNTLKIFNLCDCCIASDYCEDLSRLLKRNKSLQVLDIRRNRICELGYGKIVSGMENNTNLIELLIDKDVINLNGTNYKRINEILERNKQINKSNNNNNQ